MNRTKLSIVALGLLLPVVGLAQFETRTVASRLNRPTGLVTSGVGSSLALFFTEVPTPTVSGANGGTNGVFRFDTFTNRKTTLNMGEPEPINLAIARDGSLYWTCRSAGVILEREPNGTTGPLLTGLRNPNGIATLPTGEIAFTQVPNPGINGNNGGMNTVDLLTSTGIMNLTTGEPEPTDIAAGPAGDLYWTCKSAGVILHRNPQGVVQVLLRGLNQPTGIAINRTGTTIYFTEVPTPGVSGRMGGGNFVWEYSLRKGVRTIVNFGDSEPTDVAVSAEGRIFWTSSTAGTIVEARRSFFGI